MNEKIHVLVVFANPRGTSQLNLGREDRVIRESVQLSKNRDNIEIDVRHATTIHDLRRAMLDKDYKIVHISGHGTGSGLVLEDELGGKYVVPQTGLASLFKTYSYPSGKLECVILNACYSITQGEMISLEIPFTIAMEGAISDDAAIEFSRGFYDAVGARKSLEFAYGEGCRSVELGAPNTSFISKILKTGEKASDFESPSEVAQNSRAAELKEKMDRSLIGIAIDVSGSMQENIQNNTNRQLNRLQSFNESLKRLTNEARKTIQENKNKKLNTSIEVFAYAFGLRSGGICDLLSLLKVGKDIISPEEIEHLKRKYINEMQNKYQSYSGLGSLARQYGFGDLVRSAENVLKQSGENEIRQRIMLEVKNRLDRSLKSVGDTTLSINEVAELTNDGGETMDNATEFIFGNTPMQAVFQEMQLRFSRELAKRSNDVIPVLFLISDGEPTDGDPLPFANEIKQQGVTIITCFVTSKDISNPKLLIGQKESNWDKATSLMYDMASEIDETSNFADFLLKKGWSIQKNAKFFVQINHSSILEEFINVVLSPIESHTTNNLPVGV